MRNATPKSVVTIALVLLFLLAFAPLARAATWVYVSVGGEKRIAVFRLDEATGGLSHQTDVTVSGSPGALGTDPEKKYLFAALRSTNELASFRIDVATGGLTPIGAVPVGANSCYVATDRSGKFLLSAYYKAGQVAVHAIDGGGQISAQALQTVPTAEKAHSILTDRANRFAFVPHTGPNAVFQFAFAAETGKLSANEPPRRDFPEGAGPRHLAIHPTLDMIYFSDEQGSGTTSCKLDTAKGRLEVVETLSTLPPGFSERNTTSDIELTPDGRHLVVANRGHDSLARFRVDTKTGKLTALGQTPTEKTPRSFNISPDGKWLIAAGQGTTKLASFKLDPETGDLERLETYEVGPKPSWVEIVTMKE